MAYGDDEPKKQPKMIGRERDDRDSRLNAAKRVTLGDRSSADEISWVLFDANDRHHDNIPATIESERDLPNGALVISVDMSPLSQAEIGTYHRHNAESEDKLEIPPQSHAIYLTGREDQLKAARVALTRKIDKRVHRDEPHTSANTNYGVQVLVDKPEEHEHFDNYHLSIGGNNHPQSPVDGLRRITVGGSLFKIMERLSVEGPMSHEFKNRPLLNQKVNLVSPHLAKELFFEMVSAVRSRTGRHEQGLFERLQWPEGDENTIQGKLDRLAAADQRILEKAEEDRERYGLGKSTSRLAGEGQSSGSGRGPSGK